MGESSNTTAVHGRLGSYMSEVRNVIIIGSGPAGYTAGLYAGRAMLNPLMFAGYMSGGQLMLTSDIENFPGYPEGIGGPEMMMQLREQAERFGLEVEDRNVDEVDLSERPFKVVVEGETFLTHSIIVCTGAESLWLDAPGEAEQKGEAFPPAQPAMGPSSETSTCWSSEEGIRRAKKPPSSPGSPARSP